MGIHIHKSLIHFLYIMRCPSQSGHVLLHFTMIVFLHSQIMHDQEIHHHLQQVKELEVRLIKEKDEALSRVEQKLVEHDTNYAKLDNKLLVAYNEVCVYFMK